MCILGGDDNNQNGVGTWYPPRNPDYIPPPKMPRPQFSLVLVLCDFVGGLAAAVFFSNMILYDFTGRTLWLVVVCYLLARLRRISLWMILMYQRFTPEDIRNTCLFEPSCSEYMYLSIEKYGILAGAAKGLNRLLRCNGTSKGIDYPR